MVVNHSTLLIILSLNTTSLYLSGTNSWLSLHGYLFSCYELAHNMVSLLINVPFFYSISLYRDIQSIVTTSRF